LLSLCSLFPLCSLSMTQTRQADAVPVCIAIPLANVSSIEPCHLRAMSVRSVSSGATDAVARMFKTIRSSQRGPMLRADARTPGAGGLSNEWASASGYNRAAPERAVLIRPGRSAELVPGDDP
jgi:hypothetical protein